MLAQVMLLTQFVRVRCFSRRFVRIAGNPGERPIQKVRPAKLAEFAAGI
jgi:hypothetical protein